jgi:rSAM/selenodomain-associated transferase 2
VGDHGLGADSRYAIAVPNTISVIIPALNEAAVIARAIRSALAAGADEVVVSDGGSDDGTAAIAIDAGARVIGAPRGRGRQLNSGAAASGGDILLFLHADGLLPGDAAAQLQGALVDPGVVGGNFRIHFGTTAHARFLAAFYHVIRRLTVYYGDSAIWCRRRPFEAIGGFPSYPLMEDLKFVHLLQRRGRMAYLDGPVQASPRRWEQGGLLRTWASWVVIQTLYFYNVSPTRLARLYRHIR